MLPCIAHCCESFPSGRKDEIWSAFIYPGIHVRFLDSWYTKMCHVVHAILDSVLRTGVLVLRSWWRRSIIAKINKKSAINPAQGRHLRLVGNNTNKMDVNIFSSELKITALRMPWLNTFCTVFKKSPSPSPFLGWWLLISPADIHCVWRGARTFHFELPNQHLSKVAEHFFLLWFPAISLSSRDHFFAVSKIYHVHLYDHDLKQSPP
jgi:hypothetical protein